MMINQVSCLENSCATKTATVPLSGYSLSVLRLCKPITWILLGHKLSFSCRWKNSTVNYLLISCSVYFVNNFLGTALSLWPRNLMTRMSLSLGVSIYHLIGIFKWTFVHYVLCLDVVRRFGFKKLIGIREFHLSCLTDVSASIIIRIVVFGVFYLHWRFYYSVRCSIGSIIIVVCFHILFLPVIIFISRWVTLSRSIVV